MPLNRRLFLASALSCAALPVRAGGTVALGGRAFGSYWRIVLPEGAEAAGAAEVVRGVVARVDAALSPYRAGSELSRVNAASAGRIEVSPLTAGLTRSALALAAETGGAFDPTVGPLVARYGFGPIRAGEAGLWRSLSVTGGMVDKAEGAATLDLCGIAKGHALDLIVAGLEALGVRDVLVELGGEVAARGRHPDGRGWQVAVEGAGGAVQAVAALDDVAVATSGDAVQGYGLGGHRYGHVIDPATERPADGGLASVTVFDASAARADALATALFAMGRARAETFAHDHDLAAVLVGRDGGLTATPGARRRLIAGAPG